MSSRAASAIKRQASTTRPRKAHSGRGKACGDGTFRRMGTERTEGFPTANRMIGVGTENVPVEGMQLN